MTAANNITEAINAVMAEVGYVQKQRTGTLGYSFAGEAALIEALRPHMVEQGICCYVAGVRDVVREEYTTSKGATMNLTRLIATVRFVHAPSQTSIDTEAVGEGADTGDKGANKASTGAYKYALRQTFCIETGDDPDGFPSQEKAAGTINKPARRATPTPTSAFTKPNTDPWAGSDQPGAEPPAPATPALRQRLAVPRADPWANAPDWTIQVRDQLEAWDLRVRDVPEFMTTKGKDGPDCLVKWFQLHGATPDPFKECVEFARKYAKVQEAIQ